MDVGFVMENQENSQHIDCVTHGQINNQVFVEVQDQPRQKKNTTKMVCMRLPFSTVNNRFPIIPPSPPNPIPLSTFPCPTHRFTLIHIPTQHISQTKRTQKQQNTHMQTGTRSFKSTPCEDFFFNCPIFFKNALSTLHSGLVGGCGPAELVIGKKARGQTYSLFRPRHLLSIRQVADDTGKKYQDSAHDALATRL